MLLRFRTSKQSIHHESHAQQGVRLGHQFTIGGRDELVRCRVRPLEGNNATAAVGKQQQEPKAPLAIELLQNRNGLPFEDMRLAGDPDRHRKFAEVGSVSYGLSTALITSTCGGSLTRGSTTASSDG